MAILYVGTDLAKNVFAIRRDAQSALPDLLNQFVGANLDALRNGEAKRLRDAHVDDEFELRHLLDGQFTYRRALEDLVDLRCRALRVFNDLRSV